MNESKPSNRIRVLVALLAGVQILLLLAFPLGVRRMTDVGIRQSGMRDAAPRMMRETTLEDLRLFLSPGNYKTVHTAYAIENGVCTLKEDADPAALSSVIAPAIRLYLRMTQRGGNAMAAARAAMENGTMTQSELLTLAGEGMPESLTPTQEIAAVAAFLRAEASVLGQNPDGVRAAYLRNGSLVLVACAALLLLAGAAEETLRRRTAFPHDERAKWVGAVSALALAVCGALLLLQDAARPGLFLLAAVAAAQAVLTALPASAHCGGSTKVPRDGGERLRAALPAALGTIGAVTAVVGVCRAAKIADALNAGLSRILAGTGGVDALAVRRPLLTGAILIAVGLALLLLSRRLDRGRVFAFRGNLGGALAILPAAAGLLAALIAVLAQRFWLGALLILALIAAGLLLAAAQRRSGLPAAALVKLPGHAACAILAGVGANLAAKSTIPLSGYLICLIGALIVTRTAAKLLTENERAVGTGGE